jgi:hypothetical protein
MANLRIRRKSKKQRALQAAVTFVKARIAWVAGKKAAKVAVPAAAVGTAAVVAKKRSASNHEHAAAAGVNATQRTPAGVA